jgi:hypothetical protein
MNLISLHFEAKGTPPDIKEPVPIQLGIRKTVALNDVDVCRPTTEVVELEVKWGTSPAIPILHELLNQERLADLRTEIWSSVRTVLGDRSPCAFAKSFVASRSNVSKALSLQPSCSQYALRSSICSPNRRRLPGDRR